mgnify:CR=1 FL=1
MGQKVNPNGFRVGVIRDWNTRWYASKKEFSDFLIEDKKIRDHLKEVHYAAGIARIDIMRAAGKVTVSIYTGRPGMLRGKGGVGVDQTIIQILRCRRSYACISRWSPNPFTLNTHHHVRI